MKVSLTVVPGRSGGSAAAHREHKDMVCVCRLYDGPLLISYHIKAVLNRRQRQLLNKNVDRRLCSIHMPSRAQEPIIQNRFHTTKHSIM